MILKQFESELGGWPEIARYKLFLPLYLFVSWTNLDSARSLFWKVCHRPQMSSVNYLRIKRNMIRSFDET